MTPTRLLTALLASAAAVQAGPFQADLTTIQQEPRRDGAIVAGVPRSRRAKVGKELELECLRRRRHSGNQNVPSTSSLLAIGSRERRETLTGPETSECFESGGASGPHSNILEYRTCSARTIKFLSQFLAPMVFSWSHHRRAPSPDNL